MNKLTRCLALALVLVLILMMTGCQKEAPKATETPVVTDAPTQAPTDVPTQEPTTVPATQVPTDVPATQAPTDVPAAEETEPAEDVDAAAEDSLELASTNPVLATIGDREITLAEADEIAYLLYYYGYVEEYPNYQEAVEYLAETAIIEKHIAEAGYDQFTEEEMAAFRNEAAAEWEAQLDTYVNNYLTEDTEEARAQLRTQAEAYYASQGYSEATALENALMNEAYARMEADMRGDYVPTEEEIQNVFNEYGAQYQKIYENDVANYEYTTQYYGYESWYTPEGYRGVLHILLEADQTLLDAWEAAQVELDEAASAETVDEAAVKAAEDKLAAARQAIVDSKKTEIDDIYARLEKGESFVTLIGEYNTDPGMQDPATLESGYQVHPESIIYDQDFVKGSFQEHMTAPGTYSEPVVSGFGIHVIYYLRDVQGGLIMTDDIRTEIVTFLESNYMQDAYDKGMAEWSEGVVITVDEEMIANVTAEINKAIEEQTAAQQSTEAAQ